MLPNNTLERTVVHRGRPAVLAFGAAAAAAAAVWALSVPLTAGQVAYELVFLKFGPLFVLGLAFLAGYSTTFLAGVAIVAALRSRGSNEAWRRQQGKRR
jgi:hypothetical protein